jgi:hypothetical protein
VRLRSSAQNVTNLRKRHDLIRRMAVVRINRGRNSPICFPHVNLPQGCSATRHRRKVLCTSRDQGVWIERLASARSGRSGFNPALELTYDSSVCGGPFGFAWKFSLPAITRKADKGLSRHRDGDAADHTQQSPIPVRGPGSPVRPDPFSYNPDLSPANRQLQPDGISVAKKRFGSFKQLTTVPSRSTDVRHFGGLYFRGTPEKANASDSPRPSRLAVHSAIFVTGLSLLA